MGPCSTGIPHEVSVLGTHLYQCTSWCCCERLFLSSVIFLNFLNAVPISSWVIYKITCSHLIECSAVFDQKCHDPLCPTLTTHLISPWAKFFFCFHGWKVSSKGNVLQIWKRWNKKMTEALNGIKIDEFKNCSEQWEKACWLVGVLQQMGSTLNATEVKTCKNKYSINFYK